MHQDGYKISQAENDEAYVEMQKLIIKRRFITENGLASWVFLCVVLVHIRDNKFGLIQITYELLYESLEFSRSQTRASSENFIENCNEIIISLLNSIYSCKVFDDYYKSYQF